MAEPINYLVTINSPDRIYGDVRRRAGIVVSKGEGYVGPLDKEQLRAIKADEHLTVVKASDADTEDTSASSEAAQKIIDDANTAAGEVASKAKESADAQIAAAKTQAEKIVNAAKEEAKKITDAAKANKPAGNSN